jgi:AmiR/NasT family two-component response regulator
MRSDDGEREAEDYIVASMPEPGAADEAERLREITGHLIRAMASRAVIEQAKGVIVAREHCTLDEAFEMLRRASQRENVAVRQLAKQLVSNATRSD